MEKDQVGNSLPTISAFIIAQNTRIYESKVSSTQEIACTGIIPIKSK